MSRPVNDPDQRLSPQGACAFTEILSARVNRRAFLRAAAATAAVWAPVSVAAAGRVAGPLGFEEIAHGVDETHHVAAGHDADVLIRWGDPVVPGAPPFEPGRQSAAAQAMQFGYNNDFVGFIPLPAGARGSGHGLLCVNHEFTQASMMFPEARSRAHASTDPPRIAIEMAAHGGSVVEILRAGDGKWRVVRDGRYNRRITATTPMLLSGPAAGHRRLRTRADDSGCRVLGTLNNCAGGTTPWGTYLMAEENFHGYFSGAPLHDHAEAVNHRRYGIPGNWYHWGDLHHRFNVSREPNEPNRFGWLVEVDPFDVGSTPRKRTALGRFRREGAGTIVNRDGRFVVYMGDDQGFEYLYRYVSDQRYDASNRAANRVLLDEGTLSVARFDADGTMGWLPLVWGAGPLVDANGFHSQADVLIEARRAADLLGATPMDRPEDVEADPHRGRVYVLLTHNPARQRDRVDAANPRAGNEFGHIIELHPPDRDHAAPRYGWEMLVQCGDPAKPGDRAAWGAGTTRNGWFAAPDNAAVDSRGHLWIATDQGKQWPSTGTADGVWLLETEPPRRGVGRMFFRVPVGAEMCGPCFTPDDTTFFCAVQHPGVDAVDKYRRFAKRSTFAEPATRWPDFRPDMPVRPAVVAVTRRDGRPVGS